jgi:hypothetical protein
MNIDYESIIYKKMAYDLYLKICEKRGVPPKSFVDFRTNKDITNKDLNESQRKKKNG